MLYLFEKIGDYSFRLSKTAEAIAEKDIKFSDIACKELNTMFDIVTLAINKAIKTFNNKTTNYIVEIEALREFTEIRRDEYKEVHIKRLKEKTCNVDSGIAFIEILNICDSIVNHCLNVSLAIYNLKNNKDIVSKHEYRKDIYMKNTNEIMKKLKYYGKKYSY